MSCRHRGWDSEIIGTINHSVNPPVMIQRTLVLPRMAVIKMREKPSVQRIWSYVQSGTVGDLDRKELSALLCKYKKYQYIYIVAQYTIKDNYVIENSRSRKKGIYFAEWGVFVVIVIDVKASLRDKTTAFCFIHFLILIELCNSKYPVSFSRFLLLKTL